MAEQVRRAYRDQYLVVARRLDELYAEAQRRGELSRTKLWNYRAYRALEADLREFCEVNVMHQRDAMYKLLDRVFEDTIGATVEQFQRDKFILPYSPRAVIDTAWSGDNFSSRIWKNTNQLAERIRVEARQVVMGLKSTGVIKQQLMRDYDVSMKQAERLIDTEVSYVLNKANLEGYRRMDVQKVTIINLDVNTCEKCKALEGQVFLIDDAPVIPIHPRCHCSYCVPREGDEAEVTASGADLDRVYADHDVKGYERFPKDDGRKITFSMAEIRKAPDSISQTSRVNNLSLTGDVKADTIKPEALTLRQAGGNTEIPPMYDGNFDDFEALDLSAEEYGLLGILHRKAMETDNEYAAAFVNGEFTDPFSSDLHGRVKVPDEYKSAENLRLYHSHTNATLLSGMDMMWLTLPNVDMVAVETISRDVFTVEVGEGYRPDEKEFEMALKEVFEDSNRAIAEEPDFDNWTIEQRTYMAIREQAYRLARHFKWTLRGGRT